MLVKGATAGTNFSEISIIIQTLFFKKNIGTICKFVSISFRPQWVNFVTNKSGVPIISWTSKMYVLLDGNNATRDTVLTIFREIVSQCKCIYSCVWVPDYIWFECVAQDEFISSRDKMAAISQTIFSDAFSWEKRFVFRLKFHRSLFLRVHLTMNQHCFR